MGEEMFGGGEKGADHYKSSERIEGGVEWSSREC